MSYLVIVKYLKYLHMCVRSLDKTAGTHRMASVNVIQYRLPLVNLKLSSDCVNLAQKLHCVILFYEKTHWMLLN
jgi:hypothetical protein